MSIYLIYEVKHFFFRQNFNFSIDQFEFLSNLNHSLFFDSLILILKMIWDYFWLYFELSKIIFELQLKHSIMNGKQKNKLGYVSIITVIITLFFCF